MKQSKAQYSIGFQSIIIGSLSAKGEGSMLQRMPPSEVKFSYYYSLLDVSPIIYAFPYGIAGY